MIQTEFLRISPVLASADVARDIEWYVSKLGFKNVYDSTQYQDGPVDYVVLCRQNICFHLQYQFPEDMTSTDLKIQVKHIQPLCDEYIGKQTIKPEQFTPNTPWQTAEFSLFDPSGNRITFYEDV